MSRMVQALRQLDLAAPAASFPAELAVMDEPQRTRPQRSAGTPYEASLAQGPGNTRLARQYRRLTENVVNEFPVSRGATLFISGAGPTSHVADVAGQLAVELTRTSDVEVLLVDADAERKVLTQRFAASGERGLSENLLEGSLASEAILQSAVPRLRFLPMGSSALTRRTVVWQAVESLLGDLRRTSQFVVLASDRCSGPLAEAISRYADGTYLVVQLGGSEIPQLNQAVSSLTAAGARLLGCIATGVGQGTPGPT